VAGGVVDGDAVVETLTWAPSLGFDLDMRVGGFSLLMLCLVSGIGVLVFAYAAAYLGDRPDLARIGGLLVAFAGAMAGVVTADNLLVLYLFWEATSVTSYLLIGTEDRSATARAAALRALLTTTIGGLAMLGGFILLAQEAGTWSLSELLEAAPRGGTVPVALVLVLAGAFTKSAQFPFHYWLPGAMVAPTPVSAYLHSATMVKAGVYLIARFAPAFASVGIWRPLVVTVGLTTMFVGAWRALTQTDLKLLLAHGTTSQLGLMVALLGMGYDEVALAGATLLLAHGLFKATLFMVVGAIDHQAHTRDTRRLSRLHTTMPITTAMALVAAASMAGVPPLIGFIAKEGAVESLLHVPGAARPWLVALVGLGSVLTFAYSARFVWGLLSTEDRTVPSAKGEVEDPTEAGWSLLGPIVPLAALTVLGGILPFTVSWLVTGGAASLHRGFHAHDLALWHGLNTALLISAVVIASGSVLWLLRARVEQLQRALPHPPSGGRTFDLGVVRLLRGSDLVIGHIQTGSLPFYLMVIFSTVLLVPGVALIAGTERWPELDMADHPGQVVTVALMAVVAIGAVVLRNRLAAVLCVGAVGYGIAVMFVFQGAPDLALTQVLVETLVLVLFVLVLRHLPARFAPNQTALGRLPRAVVSVLVGALAATFVLVAFSARPDVPAVSEGYVAASPEAGGANIVNVILVEFRAFDTLGESAVLTVAALGALGLVRAARRERQRTGEDDTVAPYRTSLVLDSAVDVLGRTVLLFSIVLLFSGHDEPGGGFVGGLVAGAAYMLVFLAGGERALRRREPLAAEVFLGVGITLAVLAGAAGWIGGGRFLQSVALEGDVPGLGHLKLSSSLAFDAGVYLVVLGLVLAMLRSLGREEVQQL
jgi:multicomponent Na+:H+ antiporter subunit A